MWYMPYSLLSDGMVVNVNIRAPEKQPRESKIAGYFMAVILFRVFVFRRNFHDTATQSGNICDQITRHWWLYGFMYSVIVDEPMPRHSVITEYRIAVFTTADRFWCRQEFARLCLQLARRPFKCHQEFVTSAARLRAVKNSPLSTRMLT